jgi:hypothetical protein
VKTFRLHLSHGLSAEKYEKLVERLGFLGRYVSPVKSGGRSLVVALDVLTDHADAAQHLADNRIWSPKRKLQGERPVRVRVERIEELAVIPTMATR